MAHIIRIKAHIIRIKASAIGGESLDLLGRISTALSVKLPCASRVNYLKVRGIGSEAVSKRGQ
jgi:hypothetical protein